MKPMAVSSSIKLILDGSRWSFSRDRAHIISN
jgi:hypothetical protein